jgi:NifU-like protein
MYSETLKQRFYNTKYAGGSIQKAQFLTYGCMAAIASTDMLCEMLIGMHIDDAQKLTPKELAEKLGKMPDAKFHCSILGTFALKNAINDYKGKQNKE